MVKGCFAFPPQFLSTLTLSGERVSLLTEIGENIPQPVPTAIDGWMKSPGHRDNILRPIFTQTGVGVWQEGDKYYITQLFLLPFPF